MAGLEGKLISEMLVLMATEHLRKNWPSVLSKLKKEIGFS